MPTTTYTEQEIKLMMAELKSQLLPVIVDQMQMVNQLPPLLTTQQFMDLADISHTKAHQLFKMSGFPVTRKLGNPRVITNELFKWLNEDIEHSRLVNLRFKTTS